MTENLRLGSKIRNLRRRESLTQAQLAERLGISSSYVNLIENNRRPLSAQLLIKIAQAFQVDLQSFASDESDRMVSDLMEAFGDPLFDSYELGAADVRELAGSSTIAARAVLGLYKAYRSSQESAESLAGHLDSSSLKTLSPGQLPTEEVSDLIQDHSNYFPELEDNAETIRREANLDDEDLFQGLVNYLKDSHGIRVRIEKMGSMEGAMRRYDPEKRILYLSELLRRGSRNFQLAHQVGLVTQTPTINKISKSHGLTAPGSKKLCRVVLANYFASAILMPYDEILSAARAERYDIELLGHRFRCSVEQVCHRLTSLRRPGQEGIPFHLIRVDIAGNISKRFSASGIRFARFSAACPRWNVHAAFLTPGTIRTQISQYPNGKHYLSIARTLRKDTGGYRSSQPMQAVEIGCDIRHARELIYADGLNLETLESAVDVGVTCRLCERIDCEQRAFPPLQHPLSVDENVRGISFYAPVHSGSKA
ncbi:MAG: short-chain fatty acyl-CoA regulator family protein [Myxococcota bacterium]|nr:short-chain fatty acyl-CoA regulator family protein [Myxococcota bacterium]